MCLEIVESFRFREGSLVRDGTQPIPNAHPFEIQDTSVVSNIDLKDINCQDNFLHTLVRMNIC